MKKKVWYSCLALVLVLQIILSGGVAAFAEENPETNTQKSSGDVQALLSSSDITQYLSDLTWSSAKVGYGSATRDKDLDGNPIKLKDSGGTLQTYPKGLFAHAASQIDYDITDKGVKSFQSYIGINNMKTNGDCEFIVQVDGVEKFKSAVLNSDSVQQFVNIDIPADAKILTLITTTGGDDNNSDHSVWADAKIILDGTVQKNLKNVQLQTDKSVIKVGETAQITAKGYLVDGSQAVFQPGDLVFTSSDEAVTSVSGNGVVKGLANGTATITCKATVNGITKEAALDLAVGNEVEGRLWSVESPDKNTNIIFKLDNGSLQYSVQKQGKTVLGFSPVGINTSLGDFSNNLVYSSVTAAKEINETYSVISHKKSKYVNHARERIISFTKNSMKFDVIVRTYDDGVAFRYVIRSGDDSKQSMTVSGESTGYQIPAGSETWAMAYGHSNEWSYEDSFVEKPIESVTGDQSVPFLYRTPDGIFTLLTEAELSGEYAGTMVKAEGNGLLRVSFTPQQKEQPVSTSAPFVSPWRVAITGTLNDIVQNTMVENLSPAPDESYNYADWAEPGVTAWSWMSAGYSTANQHDKNIILKYIDFAADMGWKYYIMDEGWQPGALAGSDSNYAGYYDWFDEVRAHADAKGVKLIAWVRCDDLNTQAKRDARLIEWKKKGIAGIKVDFFDRETQDRTQLYEDIYKQCSSLGLIINTHGANKPTGEIRTYPNVLTREAIRGQEQGDLKPDQFTLFPFIRNAVGPADVTETLYPCGSSTTVGLQVASSILVQSGLHCLASSPESYLNSPAYSLYKDLPAVWDETKLIDGYPGDFATMVRRSGDDWYGASVTVEKKNAVFPLDFLNDATTYYAMVYKDDGATQNDLGFEYKEVKKGDVLTVPMKKGGGCAVKILKNKPSAIETINLDKTTASIEEGRFFTLTATITPEKSLIRNAMWTSSDNMVATVSSTGIVRGIKPGKVTITAVSPADGTIKAVCAVNVTASAYKFDANTWNIRSADTDKIRFNSENSVTITMQQGEAGNNAGSGNYLKNIIATVPADQNFAISAKVSGGLSKNYQAMALAAFTDEKNVVATMRRFHSSFGNNCFAMVRNEVVNGQANNMTEEPARTDTNSAADAYLKLVKNGKTFTSYYSYDNQNWTEIRHEDAKGVIGTASAQNIKIGIYATTGNSTDFKDVTFSNFTYYPNNVGQGALIPFAKENILPKTYTVTFDSQGADIPANPSSIEVTEPQTIVQTLPVTPIKTGFTFGGWFTQVGGQGTEFKANTVVTNNITIYAKWIKNQNPSKTYTVTFDSQGATRAANPSSIEVTEPQTTVQALPTPPVKTGFTFGGWFTQAGGQGAEFKVNTAVTNNITVYAKWTKKRDSQPGNSGDSDSSGNNSTPPTSANHFISDTTADFSVKGTYQFKITVKSDLVPALVAGTPGVFEIQLARKDSGEYYFKLIPIGKPGAQAGIYLNGVKLLVATIDASVPAVKSDTTQRFHVKSSAAYIFKLTADTKPRFVSGTPSAFRTEFIQSVGNNHYFRVIAIGKTGTASGFYINSERSPVAVATVK